MTTLYQREINHIFNRPTTEPLWYWSEHWEEGVFEDEDPLSAFVFIETLLQNPGADLATYSDDQVALGLEFVFNNSISNLACDFKVAPVSIERKTAALRALFVLFRDVFNPRCAATSSAGTQQTLSKLNGFCYMFWDDCPLSTWLNFSNSEAITQSFMADLTESDLKKMQLPEEVMEMMRKQIAQAKTLKTKSPEEIAADILQQYKNRDAETNAYYEAIAEVMRQCLSLDNPACVESGLHGLGHMAAFLPDIAVPIIDGYLKQKGRNHDQDLLDYARAARTGMIL